jgi:hypothetical protein
MSKARHFILLWLFALTPIAPAEPIRIQEIIENPLNNVGRIVFATGKVREKLQTFFPKSYIIDTDGQEWILTDYRAKINYKIMQSIEVTGYFLQSKKILDRGTEKEFIEIVVYDSQR